MADDSQLTAIIGKGEYDMFSWGWVPFVDPDPMLSYFTCDQVASDPENPTDYYNDANYCDPEYDKPLRGAEPELDPDEAPRDRARDAQRQPGGLQRLYTEPDTQAYVKDRFEGFVSSPRKRGR